VVHLTTTEKHGKTKAEAMFEILTTLEVLVHGNITTVHVVHVNHRAEQVFAQSGPGSMHWFPFFFLEEFMLSALERDLVIAISHFKR
jgi:hypothetical protein